MSEVGFIGLGTMGAPMAGHLQDGGHRLFVHTRSKVPEPVTSGGATVCNNGKEVAQHAIPFDNIKATTIQIKF